MVGAGFGFGLSFWLMRFVRETAARYTPERMRSDLADSIRSFGADLRAAAADGRGAMAEAEDRITAELDGRPRPIRRDELIERVRPDAIEHRAGSHDGRTESGDGPFRRAQ